MIFVTVGSQKFQFNRLLKEIDKLIDNGAIKEDVFAQIGVSSYIPNNFKYIDFMQQDEINKRIEECNVLITHAGTGIIIKAIKKHKKVIAVPRLKEYDEHVDNHQIQIIKQFAESKFIEPCYKVEELNKAIKNIKNKKYSEYISNNEEIIKNIEKFIDES